MQNNWLLSRIGLPASFLSLLVSACGGGADAARAQTGPELSNAAAATSAGTAGASASSSHSGGASSAVAAAAAPEPPKRERIHMYNACNKPMRLYFKRAGGSDLQTSLNTSTHNDERATDGDTIQLMDETGRNELDRIVITAAMKEVRIANGCAKLESK